MSGLDVKVGETVVTPWRNVNVTHLLQESLPLARSALIMAAQLQQTVTYTQLSEALDRRYLPRGLGNLLYLVSYDCIHRGEPLLAALVVRNDTDEPGDGWVEDTAAQQTQCFNRWA